MTLELLIESVSGILYSIKRKGVFSLKYSHSEKYIGGLQAKSNIKNIVSSVLIST